MSEIIQRRRENLITIWPIGSVRPEKYLTQTTAPASGLVDSKASGVSGVSGVSGTL
jgi:hypothetical protein